MGIRAKAGGWNAEAFGAYGMMDREFCWRNRLWPSIVIDAELDYDKRALLLGLWPGDSRAATFPVRPLVRRGQAGHCGRLPGAGTGNGWDVAIVAVVTVIGSSAPEALSRWPTWRLDRDSEEPLCCGNLSIPMGTYPPSTERILLHKGFRRGFIRGFMRAASIMKARTNRTGHG